jgi:hypothetical protein
MDIAYLRSFRVSGIALFDFLLTFLVAVILSYFIDVNIWILFTMLIVVAEIIHLSLGIDTTVTKAIIGN